MKYGSTIVSAIVACWPNAKYGSQHAAIFDDAVSGLTDQSVREGIASLKRNESAHAPTPGKFYRICADLERTTPTKPAQEPAQPHRGELTPKDRAWRAIQAEYATLICGKLPIDKTPYLAGCPLTQDQVSRFVDRAPQPENSTLAAHETAFAELKRGFDELMTRMEIH